MKPPAVASDPPLVLAPAPADLPSVLPQDQSVLPPSSPVSIEALLEKDSPGLVTSAAPAISPPVSAPAVMETPAASALADIENITEVPIPSKLSTPPLSSWASVLTGKDVAVSIPRTRIKISKGVVHSTLPVELLKEQVPLWTKFIAGHFIGDVSPHIGKVHATVNRLWTSQTKKSRIDAQFISPKVVLFKIEDENMRRRVLQRHFWHVADIPMVVQEWSPSNAGKSPDLSSIPLWVDFINVPDVLFSKRGLLFLGNLIGKAQKLHPSTERCTRFDVARVLVEVDLNIDPPSLIKLDGESEISISVAYPWLPPRCTTCGLWGHKASDCESSNTPAPAGLTSSKSPSPVPRPATVPALDSEQSNSVSAPVLLATPNVPDAVLAPPLLVSIPEQMLDHPKTVTPPALPHPSPEKSDVSKQTLTLPVTSICRNQAQTPPQHEDIPVQVIGLAHETLPDPVPVSSTAGSIISEAVLRASLVQSNTLPEPSWTIVSKAKSSPARTIMTRGKCVAAGESFSSRYQVLEKEQYSYEDIEDGEIQGSLDGESIPDSIDSGISVSLESCLGGELGKNPTKTYATRKKDNSKGARQNHKSNKSSSRKA